MQRTRKNDADQVTLRQHQRDNNYCSAAKASDDEENGLADHDLDHEDQYAGMTRGAIRRSKGHKTKRGGKRVQEQKAKKFFGTF